MLLCSVQNEKEEKAHDGMFYQYFHLGRKTVLANISRESLLLGDF